MIRKQGFSTKNNWNFWKRLDYSNKRKAISELLAATNDKNEIAIVKLEHMLEDFATSGNRNDGIANTILVKSRQYPYIIFSDAQLNGLAIMAVELKYSVPEVQEDDNSNFLYSAAVDNPSANNDFIGCEGRGGTADVHIMPKKVQLGDIVEYCDCRTGLCSEYKLVGIDMGNPRKHTISINSPVGRALLNHEVNDIVTVYAPYGYVECEIVSIN